MSKEIINRWRRTKALEIVDREVDDFTVHASSQTMKRAGIAPSRFVWLHYQEQRRPFVVEFDDTIANDAIGLSATARSNIQADVGALIQLSPTELPTLQSVMIYPLRDTQAFEGSLISAFLHPYFKGKCRPVHEEDVFTVKAGVQVGSFCVFTAGANGYGVVTPATRLTLWRRDDQSEERQDLQDPLAYAHRLQTDIDYLSSNWCAESLAKFAEDFQELLNLLQVPPPTYTEQ